MNWQQFRAILWLRWRLTRNQLTRGSGIGAALAALAIGGLILISLVIGIGATLLGALALKDVQPMVMMLVWDGVTVGVLFFWFMGVLTELQRSESVEITRLLHLPIGLKQVFVFNFLVSLISFGTILGISAMLGLALGLAIGRGWHFVLGIPLVLTFVFMVSAWIYCLRGWLLSLMVNPRRRRSIIMWITLGFILISQTPNLINLTVQRHARAEREARRQANQPAGSSRNRDKAYYRHLGDVAQRVHPWIPPLWLANGTRALADGNVLPALWGGVGMFVLGWIGLSRAYRSTVRFYRADEKLKPAKANAAVKSKPTRAASNWPAKKLPWLPDDVSAMAMAQLRSMTRAPEVRMMLAMAFFMSILLPVLFLVRGNIKVSETGQPFLATGMVVMVLFMLVQLVCNQFGCDRDAFRGLLLLPTRREHFLLGKNLALLPLAALTALVPFCAASIFGHLPPLLVLGMVAQFFAAFVMFCALGNLASILAPYRIAPGSLKPTKQSWQSTLLMMAVHLLFPLAVAPAFIPPLLALAAHWLTSIPSSLVYFVTALAMAGLFGWLYALTLRPLGRMLRQRETKILRAVTEVRE